MDTRPGMAVSENIWRCPQMGVPLNHPFVDGFSLTHHTFRGAPICGSFDVSSLGLENCPVELQDQYICWE